MEASRRRLAAVIALASIPWTVIRAGETLTLVFSFGLLDPATGYFTDVVSYTTIHTGGLPPFLVAWPIGGVLYLGLLGSVLVGTLGGREDPRVSSGLLVLLALTQVSLALGFTRRIETVAVPLGAVVAAGILWRFYSSSLLGGSEI